MKRMPISAQRNSPRPAGYGPDGKPLPTSAVVSVIGWHTPADEPLSHDTECTVNWEVPHSEAQWDDSKHGKGTRVTRKSDRRRGASTMKQDRRGEIRIRWDRCNSVATRRKK